MGVGSLCLCTLGSVLHSDWLSGIVVGVSTSVPEVQPETNIVTVGAHGVYTRLSHTPTAFLSAPVMWTVVSNINKTVIVTFQAFCFLFFFIKYAKLHFIVHVV